jgi:hypothetical protein
MNKDKTPSIRIVKQDTATVINFAKGRAMASLQRPAVPRRVLELRRLAKIIPLRDKT